MSIPDNKYLKDLWDNFVSHYEYVGKCLPLIRYPDWEFEEQGIPKPWQTIAWRKVIRKIGENNFCGIPITLNYVRNDEVLFKTQFQKFFASHPNPEKLKVTFICGYFWLYNDNRRDPMLNYVVNSVLEEGTKVEIWTEDDTLEEAFNKKLGDSPARYNLKVNYVYDRIDVHYTLIEDNTEPDNSLLLMELPHTEAHLLRMEISLTLGELGKFVGNTDEFLEYLRGYIKQGRLKKFLSRHNLALRTG